MTNPGAHEKIYSLGGLYRTQQEPPHGRVINLGGSALVESSTGSLVLAMIHFKPTEALPTVNLVEL